MVTPRRRMGRPPKPAADRKAEILRFRVPAAEADRLYRAALCAGKCLSAYLRERLTSCGPALDEETQRPVVLS